MANITSTDAPSTPDRSRAKVRHGLWGAQNHSTGSINPDFGVLWGFLELSWTLLGFFLVSYLAFSFFELRFSSFLNSFFIILRTSRLKTSCLIRIRRTFRLETSFLKPEKQWFCNCWWTSRLKSLLFKIRRMSQRISAFSLLILRWAYQHF